MLHALQAFGELGCEIVFCTGTLADSELAELLPLVRWVVVRNRFGLRLHLLGGGGSQLNHLASLNGAIGFHER